MSSFSIKDKLGKSHKSLSCFDGSTPKTVEEWLDNLELANYKSLFKKYKCVEDLLKLSVSSLKRLGVKDGAHRARMMSSITLLRDAVKKSGSGSALRLERMKQEATIPRSIFKLMFHSNKALTSPVGIVPSLGLPSTRDLERVVWYHGLISRLEAESLLMKEGDFLVRDSSSHPGELVLTCYKENRPMHFVINCIDCQRYHGVSEKFYKFDDEAFPSITNLIIHHLESGKPVTRISGAVLLNPIPNLRSNVTTEKMPGSLNDNHFSSNQWTGSQPLLSLDEGSPMRGSSSLAASLERCGSVPSMFKNLKEASKSPLVSEASIARSSIERLSYDKKRASGRSKPDGELGDQSLLGTAVEDSNAHPKLTAAATTTDGEHFPPPPEYLLSAPILPPSLIEINASSTPFVPPSSEISASSPKAKPPPKPSRVPTLRFNDTNFRPMVKVRSDGLHNDDSDDDNDGHPVTKAEPQAPSSHDGELQTSPSLLPNNKPLDPVALSTITLAILSASPGTIARHITYIDIRIFQIVPTEDHELGLVSGLELLTLPQGHFLRQKAIERHHCLRMFTSAVILKGQSVKERGDLISHWLSVAMELKANTGNIFSFYSIMDALCSSQLVRLRKSWRFVKQYHQSVFGIFETKLLTCYRTFLDASGLTLPHQKDTITPHIFPLLDLLERSSSEMDDEGLWKLGSWEMNQPFFGLEVILIHLETARLITSRIHLYKDATERFLASNSSSLLNNELLSIFDPVVQAKFLCGSKGAEADRSERLAKFDHLLSLLSEVVEKDVDGEDEHMN